MITTEQIRQIPLRYQIGKRPLSLVLGWGEITYTRLLQGSTPSPDHAKQLTFLYEHPVAFARALIQSKDKITDLTFNKSMAAVNSHIEEDIYDALKIYEVADYLCALSKGEITPKALHLLLFFVQGISFAKRKRPLLNIPIQLKDGLPYYQLLEYEYDFETIQLVAQDKRNYNLGKGEMEYIRNVFSDYSDYSSLKLAELASKTTPVKKAIKRGAEELAPKQLSKYFAKN